MSKAKRTYNPCDDCQYSYSKNNQESGMCKICEFPYFRDRKQSEGEWISVDERLPDENGRFLTVDEKGDMMVCFWEKHFGWFAMVCNKNAITHWMPLPEPPDMKGGE